MAYTYTLLVLDEAGETVIEHDLAADEAVRILAGALKAPLMAPPVKRSNFDGDGTRSTSQQRKWHKGNKRGKKLQDEIEAHHAHRKMPQRAKKECCGSTGSRHFKWCTKKDGSAAPTDPTPSAALGPDRYEAIREAMNDREFQSAEYALVHKLSPREVNAAVRSADYTDYLDNR